LPDGLFSNQKSQFLEMFEGLRLENVVIFYRHLEYFMDIWNILWTFGIIYDRLVHFVFIWYIFSGFGYHAPKTPGNPGFNAAPGPLFCFVNFLNCPHIQFSPGWQPRVFFAFEISWKVAETLSFTFRGQKFYFLPPPFFYHSSFNIFLAKGKNLKLEKESVLGELLVVKIADRSSFFSARIRLRKRKAIFSNRGGGYKNGGERVGVGEP
jgi:hypothetical protein